MAKEQIPVMDVADVTVNSVLSAVNREAVRPLLRLLQARERRQVAALEETRKQIAAAEAMLA